MEEKILSVINAVLENKGMPRIETLDASLHLREDLGFDSFDLAELTVRIENIFNVDVFADGIVNTVGDVYKKING
jgi:acyl carrier protein